MIFDEIMRTSEMTRMSVHNKQRYAARHNYELITAGAGEIDPSRPPAWSKLLALRRHLPRFDYLLFVDVDTLVMNPDITLDELVARGGSNSDLIFTEDWNGVNSGVFMVRNSTWTHWFLDEAWGPPGSEQEYMALHEKSQHGLKYPFEYEQRSLHYLLQTRVWTGRGLPRFIPSRHPPALLGPQTALQQNARQRVITDTPIVDTSSVAPTNFSGAARSGIAEHGDLWSHVTLLPQCALNSYMLYPRLSSLSNGPSLQYVTSQWVPGDFIVHMAGHKGPNKADLFKFCFEWSEQSFRERRERHAQLRK
eukprot:CAMPEP_0171801136 /NCGR_PEP_ID=MMETSP0991-20121206/72086_1 /TAXON_ID=483369 /ORGANISM="non described non described, Strain CCMP2098" /LENGTH=306 /DNA_ID=CAMNT_0012412761 /DNA_START=324 /DNA_END=1241 /DNA_ORIENTATION=-